MIKTLKQTISNIYYWIKKKLIQFKKWLVLIIFGAAVVAAPLALPNVPDVALEKIQQKYETSELKDKYRLEKTAFILDAIDENAIQAEVGNKNLDKFVPELTLRKWDDEVSFKIKYKHNEKKKDQKIDIENKKIKWKGKKTEVHYYDIKKGELLHDKVLEHDVFEVEVILLEKPDTNIVGFDIETKGLAFYYQPELTQEEKDEGAERPENVIGSYAVYHESKQGDYSKMGKKNYRAGKAFHIYQPKIIDNVGTEIWGKLNITDNLLTVEIPKEFLDNAVYPIRHAAGLTFGYTSIGATPHNFVTYGPYASEFTGAAGTATKISIGITSGNSGQPNTEWKVAIYSGDGSTPTGAALRASNGLTPPDVGDNSSGVFVDLDLTSSLEISAQNYWLAFNANPSDGYNVIWRDDTGGHHSYDTTAYGTFPTWSETGGGTRKYSIYCTYTAGEEEARRMFLTQ